MRWDSIWHSIAFSNLEHVIIDKFIWRCHVCQLLRDLIMIVRISRPPSTTKTTHTITDAIILVIHDIGSEVSAILVHEHVS